MNHQQLIDTISAETHVKKMDVLAVLRQLAIEIRGELAVSGAITLHHIGTFKAVETPERQGRNPNTGDSITIAAGKRVKFKAAKGLKEAL